MRWVCLPIYRQRCTLRGLVCNDGKGWAYKTGKDRHIKTSRMEVFRKQAYQIREDRYIKTSYQEIFHKQAYETGNDRYIKTPYKEIFQK